MAAETPPSGRRGRLPALRLLELRALAAQVLDCQQSWRHARRQCTLAAAHLGGIDSSQLVHPCCWRSLAHMKLVDPSERRPAPVADAGARHTLQEGNPCSALRTGSDLQAPTYVRTILIDKGGSNKSPVDQQSQSRHQEPRAFFVERVSIAAKGGGWRAGVLKLCRSPLAARAAPGRHGALLQRQPAVAALAAPPDEPTARRELAPLRRLKPPEQLSV